jgi:hypothetical protein
VREIEAQRGVVESGGDGLAMDGDFGGWASGFACGPAPDQPTVELSP